MRRADRHRYQVLTKRSERMRDFLRDRGIDEAHVWWGVSVEDRRHGLPRVDHLRDAPTANRFLSIEPLLARIPTLGSRHNTSGFRVSTRSSRPGFVTGSK